MAKYLDLIGMGEASAQQIAAFGNFLGQAGRAETALAYYDLALDLDDGDTTIWLNAGTLQRQVGNLGAATSANRRIRAIPNGQADRFMTSLRAPGSQLPGRAFNWT